MSIAFLLKALPYIGYAGLALTAFFFYLRATLLANKNRALTGKIESLRATVEKQDLFLNKIKKDIQTAKDHAAKLRNNKEESDKLINEVRNAKSTDEILSIISNTIRV